MAIPRTPVQGKRERSVAALAELDEIEDFLEQLVGLGRPVGARHRRADLLAQTGRPDQRGLAAEAERLDGHHFSVASATRDRQHRRPGEEIVQREGTRSESVLISLLTEKAPNQPRSLFSLGRGGCRWGGGGAPSQSAPRTSAFAGPRAPPRLGP